VKGKRRGIVVVGERVLGDKKFRDPKSVSEGSS